MTSINRTKHNQYNKLWTGKQPKKKEARFVSSTEKMRATVFYAITMERAYYVPLLDKLKEEIAEKYPYWQKKILFHPDNTPSQTWTIAIRRIDKLRTKPLDRPPRSLDLDPTVLLFFSSQAPKLTVALKE